MRTERHHPQVRVRDERQAPAKDRWLFVFLLSIVTLSPLPLGSNHPLPMTIIACCTGLMLIAWSHFWNIKHISLHPQCKKLKWPLILYLSVCVWILVQSLPSIPSYLANPVWQNAATNMKLELGSYISVDPFATQTGLMHLLVYGSIFWLTFNLTMVADRAWTAIRVLALAGAAYALYGIVIFATGNHWILFFPKIDYEYSLTSTFVNRNSYATFAGLSLLCAAILLIQHMSPLFALKHPPRAKFAIIVEEFVAKSAWRTLVVLLIAISLPLSASRAGLGSTMVGLVIVGTIYLLQRKLTPKRLAYSFVALATFMTVVFTASGNLISKRFEVDHVDNSYNFRLSIYRLTLDAINTEPWKGTGFGTYVDIMPAYKEPGGNSVLERWDKAHNTYLENALELGVPAALILNLSIGLLALYSARGIVARRRNKLIPVLGVGATALVALHSVVDFSLQIPAVSIIYACIMGIALSQSWSSHSAESNQHR